jgi:hypothetical protein
VQDFIRLNFTNATIIDADAIVFTTVLMLILMPFKIVSFGTIATVWVLLTIGLVIFIFTSAPSKPFTLARFTVVAFISIVVITIIAKAIFTMKFDSISYLTNLFVFSVDLNSSKIPLFPFAMLFFVIIMGLDFIY